MASAVEQAAIDHERDKYRTIWREPSYRTFSPGETFLERGLAMLAPEAGASFIDFGIGTGRAAQALIDRGHHVMGVDIADNCLDPGLRIPLFVGDLARLPDLSADYGLCCDVMEHIRPVSVDNVLREIARCAKIGVFFSICLQPDGFGALIGEPLHLTVKPASWWQAMLAKHFASVVIEADDVNLLAACRHAPAGFTHHIEVDALANSTNEVIFANIRANSQRDEVAWLHPVEAHDGHAVMVGGGPSLKSELAGIAARKANGQTIFALNGAAAFLAENGIEVDYQVVLDARPENVDFLKARSAKKYLLASQCHPSLFDELKGCDVTLFHYPQEGVREMLKECAPKGRWITFVAGDYTVGPIAMSVATVLGYRQLHLYGYDSSDADDGAAHAYEQHETSAEERRLHVLVGGRKFRCSFAMFKQAETFPAFASMLAEHGCVITVHGDGLLPTVARDMMNQAQTQ